jgi:hypothetical protein
VSLTVGIRYTTPLVFSAPGTADAVLDGSKTVTRRLIRATGVGFDFWVNRAIRRWRVGSRSRIYRRSPRNGGKPIGMVLILSVRAETLGQVTLDEVRREGFPNLSVAQFLTLFQLLHPGHSGEWNVLRIELGLAGEP